MPMKSTTKKIAVASFVAIVFVVYSFHQRNEGTRAATQTTQASSSSTTPSSQIQPQTSTQTQYKDGTYTGKSSDALYGYIQVKATVSGGKLTDITFLDYPQDQRNSIEINNQAMPLLKQQAIASQSAHVDGVSGATDTSQAFIESLGDALSQAQA